MINDEIPTSSAKLFFDELLASGKSVTNRGRPGHYGRRVAEDSSEDEGEILEDEETSDEKPSEAAESSEERPLEAA